MRMEDTSLLKYVMFGELVGGRGCVGEQEKRWVEGFLDDLRALLSARTIGRLQPRTRRNGTRRRNKGRNVSWRNGSLQIKTRAGLRHAVVCPSVTGRTKERIAQSKRARAGSIVIDN